MGDVPSPCYALEESLLRRNLSLIAGVAKRLRAEIILAFKVYALWRTFPIFGDFIHSSTASSVYEAQLGFEEMGALVHAFSPGYTEENFGVFQYYSGHIAFNSLSQLEQLHPQMQLRPGTGYGLRISPGYSVIEADP